MRDDLHRTPSLPRAWRAAVLYAQKPADEERVAHAMSKAVRTEMEASVDPRWLNELRHEFSKSNGDMFPQETRAYAISKAERTASSPMERLISETARGLCAKGISFTSLMDSTIDSVLRRSVENMIEHASAHIRTAHGPYQARLLRDRMTAHLPECSFRLGGERIRKVRFNEVYNLEV